MPEFALEVENLVKVYRPRHGAGVRAVDGISFTVPRGIIFGLLGPNGAGKTTTLKMLTTLIRPTHGHARVMGHDVERQALDVRRNISVVIQETAVEQFLNARDNLLTFARFHGVPQTEARRRADRVMQLFHLQNEAGKKVMDLSGGYRRRVQVAKTLMVDTPVVFMDEFSTGMDPILKRAVMQLLRAEAQRGRTIILTTQILHEAEELCDDILIMNRGAQVARGDLHALKLLSEGVHEVSITFDALPEGIRSDLEKLAPVRLEIHQTTVEFAFKAEESRALEVAAELARRGRVLRAEISGASLEDIFVELMQKQGNREGRGK
jgi:ABC-2 type transport system ATP-binding protein